MKVLVCLVLFVAAAQAKATDNYEGLEFVHKYVEPNPKYTAQEWEKIYTDVSDIKVDDPTGLVLGTEPQDENAGKVYVKPNSRIISGTAVTQGQIPWQALLIMGGTSLCGGSLISSEWIFTAAHCLNGFSSFQISLGVTSRSASQSGTVMQNACEALIHASYDSDNIANDIELLKLDVINAFRLPRYSQASVIFEGSQTVVSGFRRVSSILNVASANLLYADVTVIANTRCAATFGAILQASNICTVGKNGRSPCNGDSGGPLVVEEADGQYTGVGVVSFGIRNCPAVSQPPSSGSPATSTGSPLTPALCCVHRQQGTVCTTYHLTSRLLS